MTKLSREERKDLAKKAVLDFLDKNKVAHVREIKVALEREYFHWVTENAINELYHQKKLRRRTRAWAEEKGKTATFYYLSSLSYMDVSSTIEEKLDIIAKYTALSENPERRERMGYLAEDLVISSLIKAGYVVTARDAKFFNGKEWSRKTDLDLVIHGEKEKRWYGAQIKNTLDYPEWDDIAELIDICRFLGLVPWLICRISPKDYNWELIKCGGFVTLFYERRWLLTEENLKMAEEIAQKTKIPVSTSKCLKDFREALIHDLNLIHSIPIGGRKKVT